MLLIQTKSPPPTTPHADCPLETTVNRNTQTETRRPIDRSRNVLHHATIICPPYILVTDGEVKKRPYCVKHKDQHKN